MPSFRVENEVTVRRVWVTGAGGLIGGALMAEAGRGAPGIEVIGLTRQRLDLTDAATVRSEFSRQRPDLIIHCAALSRSPDCQRDPVLARRLNVETTALLADMARDIALVFFSTDLVFDGLQGAYTETAPTRPLSVYAETKVEAEAIVLRNPRHTVIRTSLNGGISSTGDRGFNEQLRLAWRRGETLRLFIDEFRSPIPAVVTARATWELALKHAPGLYHVAGSQRLSRWEMGQLVAGRCPELRPRYEQASIREYPGAQRAPDTSLDCGKAQALLSFRLPGLGEWLASNPQERF
jgi:dTDP-4-dehydrorhamnose reductase